MAFDELGTLYVGQSFGSRIAAIPVAGIEAGAPYQVELPIWGLSYIRDLVHDGNNHLFVSGSLDSGGRGKIWRVDTLTGLTREWTSNRGPSFGYEDFNPLFGITIDAFGDLWAIEDYSSSNNRAGLVKVSGADGSVLDYFQMPALVEGFPAASNRPQGLAVLGVNLPSVREACASDCPPGQITDCYGACMWAASLGDGFCDEGPHANLTCWGRAYDSGDCNYCPPYQVPDCNGNCGPLGWVGDGICDASGSISYFNGQYISYDCPEFRFDEATCRGCSWGEMLDCNGNCSPSGWYGDGICDDGGWFYLGHPVDYHCVEYDFDRNDCR